MRDEWVNALTVVVEYLKDDAIFDDLIDSWFVKNRKLTKKRLLWQVSFVAGPMAAIFTNDVMCVAMTKPICDICRRRSWHPGPYMLAIAMSANAGSALTLIGNPQNAMIAAIANPARKPPRCASLAMRPTPIISGTGVKPMIIHTSAKVTSAGGNWKRGSLRWLNQQ